MVKAPGLMEPAPSDSDSQVSRIRRHNVEMSRKHILGIVDNLNEDELE